VIQEQKQNIIENQRQLQFQAKLESQKKVLAGMSSPAITAPPDTGLLLHP
jgi:hypothetical protein